MVQDGDASVGVGDGCSNPNMQCLPHTITLAASAALLGDEGMEEKARDREQGAPAGGGAAAHCLVGVRECVVASTGRVLVSIDYAQLELRLMAHFSQVALWPADLCSQAQRVAQP
jgi:hypothetical protein